MNGEVNGLSLFVEITPPVHLTPVAHTSYVVVVRQIGSNCAVKAKN